MLRTARVWQGARPLPKATTPTLSIYCRKHNPPYVYSYELVEEATILAFPDKSFWRVQTWQCVHCMSRIVIPVEQIKFTTLTKMQVDRMLKVSEDT